MTTSRLNRKVQVALGSAVAALLIVGAISYRVMLVSQESDRSVRHTYEVLDGLDDFLFALERTDSAFRGFVLTGSDVDLASFRAGRLSAEQAASRIRSLTADNAGEQRQLPRLESLVAQKFQFLEMAIGVRQVRGVAAAVQSVRSDLGKWTRALQEIAGTCEWRSFDCWSSAMQLRSDTWPRPRLF